MQVSAFRVGVRFRDLNSAFSCINHSDMTEVQAKVATTYLGHEFLAASSIQTHLFTAKTFTEMPLASAIPVIGTVEQFLSFTKLLEVFLQIN